jgi:hypothetical protein
MAKAVPMYRDAEPDPSIRNACRVEDRKTCHLSDSRLTVA